MQTIPLTDLMSRFRTAFRNIRDAVDLLSRLDAATGDGDHGVTMVRIVDKAEAAMSAKEPAAMFKAMGMSAMSAGGGSAGPLMGQFFMGMANGVPKDTDAMTAADVAKLFEAGYLTMFKFSKAGIGDRTMMDALKPAVDVMLSHSADGADINAMLTAASAAATAGAEATINMLAKFGRARNLGERVLGHPDPGATSWSLIFQGLAAE